MDSRLRAFLCIGFGVLMISSATVSMVGAPGGAVQEDHGLVTAARLPDLVPLGITTSPVLPVSGQTTTISSQVMNQGTVTIKTTFINTMSVDQVVVANQTLTGLKAATSGPIWSAAVVLGPGYHGIQVFADRTNVVQEYNEGNNFLSHSLWWASPDLTITSAEISQSGDIGPDIVSGEPFDVTLTVANAGDAPSEATSLEIRDVFNSVVTTLASAPVGALPPSQSTIIQLTGLFLNETGDHVLRVIVDPQNIVPEGNKATGTSIGTGEANNVCEVNTPVKLEWLVMGYIAYEGMMDSPDNTYDTLMWLIGKIWNTTVNHSDNVRVILLVDRLRNWDGANDSNTRVYELADNAYSMISDLGELNVGDPSTLSDFIIWATTAYPAEKLLLWMYDHGYGWKGSCHDILIVEGYPVVYQTDDLNATELKTALATASSSIGSKIDVLAWYACMMGNLEVAYQIKDSVKVMAGCEDSEGLPVYVTIRNLISNPSCNATELGAMLVYDFGHAASGWDWIRTAPIEQSEAAAIDLSRLDSLAVGVESFSQHLRDRLEEYRSEITICRSGVMSFGYEDFVDLYHFVELVGQSDIEKNAAMVDAMQQVREGIEHSVISLFHTEDYADTHGMTIYLPSEYLYDCEYGRLDFCHVEDVPSWNRFLKEFSGCYVPDYLVYIGTDEWVGANAVGSGVYYSRFLNDFEPTADLTTGNAYLVLEATTGSMCPSGDPGVGEVTFSGYAGFRGFSITQPYDGVVSLTCTWNGTYSATIVASQGGEATFAISAHAEVRDWTGEPMPNGTASVVVESGVVADGNVSQLSTVAFSVTVNLEVSLSRDCLYELVTYMRGEVWAVSTVAGDSNGALAYVDIAPDPGSPGEMASCSCLRLLPVMLDDDFTDGTMDPWIAVGDYTIITNETSHTPEYSLEVWYSNSTLTGTQMAFAPATGVDTSIEYTIEFWYLTGFTGASRTAAFMYILDDGRVRIVQDGGSIVAVTPSGNVTLLGSVVVNTWYKIRLSVDPGSSVYDAYIDDRHVGCFELLEQGTGDTIMLGSPVNPEGRIAGLGYWDDFIISGYSE
jgi:hypothetical protein